MTSGQPPRGTELLAIQWRNAANGLRRSIFLENGLVSLVTSCLKGYSITGSTKIIHRYLPVEVSELLVYYLWLIVPFCTQIKLLVPDIAAENEAGSSAFLWSKRGQPWHSDRLSKMLSDQFREYLNTSANIVIWRHAAIAISRKHISGRGFKRDYSVKDEEAMMDGQAGHSSILAGQIYARGIEEAPGHVASARAEYRDISRRWHTILGFGVALEPRKECNREALEEIRVGAVANRERLSQDQREAEIETVGETVFLKRKREDLEIELEVLVNRQLELNKRMKKVRGKK
jgi:hypothetical protein